MVSVWSKEFDEYADFPYIVRAMQGTAKKKVELLHDIETSKRVFKTEPLQVAVINYESAWRTNEDKPKESIFDALLTWKPDMIAKRIIGQYYYQAELHELKANCVHIVALDKVEEVQAE